MPTGEWVQLFNGKDLTGWKTHPDRPGKWSVENGLLVGRKPPGYLFSERGDYGDFHLRAEVKINATGNSGLGFRSEFGFNFDVRQIGGSGFCPIGYEAELAVKGAVGTKFPTGTLYRRSWEKDPKSRSALATSDEVKADQWLTLEVIARGDQFTTLVDGKAVVEFTDPATIARAGHLSLQALTSDTVVQFKRIEIKELPPEPTPKSIDLLALIDPVKHALDPGVRMEKGVLFTPAWGGGNTRVVIPHQPTADEYDLHLVAERKGTDRHGLNLGFVMGGRQAVLSMDGSFPRPAWCIEHIDGKSMHNGNPTRVDGTRFPLHTKVRVELQVRKASVKVLCEGQAIIDWKGKPEQLTLWDKIVLPDRQSLFFYSQAAFAIHEIEIMELPPDPNQFTLVHRFDPANSQLNQVRYTPDGKHAVSISNDHFLRIHRIASGKPTKGFRVMGGPRGLALLKNGEQAIITGENPSKVELWDLVNAKKLQSYDATQGANHVAVAPGERIFAVASDPPELWEVNPPKRLKQLIGHKGAALGIAFSNDGTRVATGGGDAQVIVWDASTGGEMVRFKGPSGCSAVAFSQDGTRLLSGHFYGEFCVWDLTTKALIHKMQGHTRSVRSINLLKTGNHALTGSDDGTIRLWDLGATEIAQVKTEKHDANSVDVSPDGRYCVSGGGWYFDLAEKKMKSDGDFALRLWKLPESVWPEEGLTLLRKFEESHPGPVHALAVTPDGRQVLSGSINATDRSVLLYDRASGKLVYRFDSSKEGFGIAISQDGRSALVSDRIHLCIYDLPNRKLLHRIRAHEEPCFRTAISPDGEYVLTGSTDKTAAVWELETGKELARIPLEYACWAAAFMPNGKIVLGGWTGPGLCELWDWKTGKRLNSWQVPVWVKNIAIAPDGRSMLVCGHDGLVRLIDLKTNQSWDFKGHAGIVWSVQFLPDGRHCVSGGEDGTLRIWSLESKKEIASQTSETRIFNTLAVTPDGREVVSGGGFFHKDKDTVFESTDDYAIRLWQLPESVWPKDDITLVHRLEGSTAAIHGLAFSPGGEFVFAVRGVGAVHQWDAKTGAPTRTFGFTGAGFRNVACLPDGKKLVTTDFNGGVSLWDLATGKLVREFSGHTKQVNGLAVSPDGTLLLTGSDDNTVRLWDVATGKQLQQFDGWCRAAAFAPDGKTAAFANTMEAVLFEVATRKTTGKFRSVRGTIRSLDFSPDGKLLVGGSDTGVVHVWDLAGARTLHTVSLPAPVRSTLFLPDGRHFVAGCEDKTLRIYRTTDGQEVERVTGENHYTHQLALSPDRRFLASAGGNYLVDQKTLEYENDGDYALRLWQLPESVWPNAPLPAVAPFDAPDAARRREAWVKQFDAFLARTKNDSYKKTEVDAGSRNHMHYYRYVIYLAYRDDAKEHARYRSLLLNRFPKFEEWTLHNTESLQSLAARTVSACLLLPTTEKELATLTSLWESASAKAEPFVDPGTRGMLDYRSGRFATAAEHLARERGELLKGRAPWHEPMAVGTGFQLALALARQGKVDAALATFGECEKEMMTGLERLEQGKTPLMHLHDWMRAAVLWREANGVLADLSKLPPPAIAPFDAKKAKEHQDAWAKHLGVDVEITNSLGMKLRLIPPGEFTRGFTKEQEELALVNANAEWERTLIQKSAARPARVPEPFYLGAYEVTIGEFQRFVKATGYRTTAERNGKGGQVRDDTQKKEIHRPEYIWSFRLGKTATVDDPVEFVTPEDADAFCTWLSKLDGRRYALVSEEQWEFACRAGTTTLWWTGDDPNVLHKHERLKIVTPKASGASSPNPFGLYDMHGNLMEWVRTADGIGQRSGTTGNPVHWVCSGLARAVPGEPDKLARSRCGFRVAIVGDLKAPAPAPAVAPFDANQAKAHQDAWAKHLGVDVETTNSIGMKLRLIPPGTFLMGSTQEEVNKLIAPAPPELKNIFLSETPQRQMTIDAPFYLGRHEVTVGQFRQFVKETNYKTFAEASNKGGIFFDVIELKPVQAKEYIWSNPKFAVSEQHAVVFITPEDAKAFCAWLSKKEGRCYVVPREEQWEFACRAGTTTAWWCGDDFNEVNNHELVTSTWKFQPVGLMKANPFGLFDMHGNVIEWSLDANNQPFRRGDRSHFGLTRSAARPPEGPKTAWNCHGFRVAVVGDLKARLPADNNKPKESITLRAQLPGHTDEIRDLTFFPDGTQLASSGADKRFRIWGVQNGGEVYQMPPCPHWVSAVAISPDGQLAAVGFITTQSVAEIEIWQLVTRKRLHVLKGPPNVVYSLAFSPDGLRLLSTGQGAKAMMWDAKSGKLLYEIEQGTDNVFHGVFAPDGRTFVTVSSTAPHVVLRDAAQGKPIHELRTPQGRAVRRAAFSPDGKQFIVATLGNDLPIFDTATGKLVRTINSKTSNTLDVVFSGDGRFIIIGSGDRTLRIYDVQSGNLHMDLHDERPVVTRLALSPDGTMLATGGGITASKVKSNPVAGDFDIRLWKLPESVWPTERFKESSQLKGHIAPVDDVAYVANAKLIASVSKEGLKLWVTDTGKLDVTLMAGLDLTRLAVSPKGTLAAAAGSDGVIHLLDLEQRKLIGKLTGHTKDLSSLDFSFDGKQLLSRSRDKTIRRWDVAEQKQLDEIAVSTEIGEALFLPQSTAFVHNAGNWLVRSDRPGPTQPILSANTGFSLAVSPREGLAAVGGWNGMIDVVDLNTMTVLSKFTCDDRVTSLAFTHDGSRVVSGSFDRTLRMWDARSGRELARITMNTRSVNHIAVCPDRHHIATAGGMYQTSPGKYASDGDYTVRIWRLPESREPMAVDSVEKGKD